MRNAELNVPKRLYSLYSRVRCLHTLSREMGVGTAHINLNL